jgi:nitrogen fixation-related uncharacterized protein
MSEGCVTVLTIAIVALAFVALIWAGQSGKNGR